VFVQNAIVQRHLGNQHAALRGCLLRISGGAGETRELGSADAYVATLAETFGIELPEAATLWPRIQARHREVFPDGYRPGT
jgi:N-hydroxyarylamine O-acetyltransferase